MLYEVITLDNIADCCLLSEISAALCLNGTAAVVQEGNINIRITTENAAYARRIFSNIRKLCDVYPEVTIRKSKKLKKHVSYMLFITSTIGSSKLLDMAGVVVETPAGAGEHSPELRNNFV